MQDPTKQSWINLNSWCVVPLTSPLLDALQSSVNTPLQLHPGSIPYDLLCKLIFQLDAVLVCFQVSQEALLSL